MKKLSDIEESQTFLGNEYDTMKNTVDQNQKCVTNLQGEIKSLTKENKKLKTENSSIYEDVLDLKCRSMRDNIIFLGIEEQTFSPHRTHNADPTHQVGLAESGVNDAVAMDATNSAEGSESHITSNTFAQSVQEPSHQLTAPYVQEDCASKIYQLCESVLKIKDVRNKIYIDRAHRIGGRVPGKTRPIVAKFLNTSSKLEVKSALKNVDLSTIIYKLIVQIL